MKLKKKKKKLLSIFGPNLKWRIMAKILYEVDSCDIQL
jgi:hypothetical protein